MNKSLYIMFRNIIIISRIFCQETYQSHLIQNPALFTCLCDDDVFLDVLSSCFFGSCTKVCFLSDQMTMLRKVQTSFVQKQWECTQNKTARCDFSAWPCGIKGNEGVDNLVSRAPMVEGRAMNGNDIFNAFRDTCWNEFSGNELDYTL